mmetsp:Transcript_18526/g.70289  ORF Transcript_18526/g.70289 Transcript_18526/m.70289 type:complete len:223 (-) Transcript_18526:71-739(-)
MLLLFPPIEARRADTTELQARLTATGGRISTRRRQCGGWPSMPLARAWAREGLPSRPRPATGMAPSRHRLTACPPSMVTAGTLAGAGISVAGSQATTGLRGQPGGQAATTHGARRLAAQTTRRHIGTTEGTRCRRGGHAGPATRGVAAGRDSGALRRVSRGTGATGSARRRQGCAGRRLAMRGPTTGRGTGSARKAPSRRVCRSAQPPGGRHTRTYARPRAG